MLQTSDLSAYFASALGNVIREATKAVFKNPKEAAFLLSAAKNNVKSQKLRDRYEHGGDHIPAFLIASITDACNLFCTGCYARANGLCGEQRETRKEPLLSAEEWGSVFSQARALGVSFVLLAGGEPLLRKDVLERAAKETEMLFPVFTNGTLLSGKTFELLEENRHLIPVVSVEGGEVATDARRGKGAYGLVREAMERMRESGMLFGASVTVTAENLSEVTSEAFLNELYTLGCRLVFYIEYVPVDAATKHLAPGEEERCALQTAMDERRKTHPSMIFLAFPGDEQFMGGCLAAGRGFFHISPSGAAEPCPFSPYSDCSVREKTLLEVLRSPFFKRLREKGLVGGEHDGGCALFEHEADVKALLTSAEVEG